MCSVVPVPGKCILSCAVGFQRGLHKSPVSLLKSPALGCALFFMQIGLTLWDNTLHGHISAIWKQTFWGFTFYIYLNNNEILFDFLLSTWAENLLRPPHLAEKKNVSTVSQFNSDLVKLAQDLIKKVLCEDLKKLYFSEDIQLTLLLFVWSPRWWRLHRIESSPLHCCIFHIFVLITPKNDGIIELD